MQKIFAVIILSSFLVACSDDSNDENESSSDGPSLAEITGVWDASETHGQVVDERYLVFKKVFMLI